MKNLFTTEVSDIEKKIVFFVVFILYVIFALVSSLSHIEYSPIPGFISICGVSIFIISLQTAFLLYNQSKISLDSANSLLSSGFLFISFLVIARTIFLPGTVLPSDYLGQDSQIAAWLWTIWHISFPVYIILYSLINSKFSLSFHASQIIFKLIPFISILIILLLALNDSALPRLLSGNDYSSTIYVDLSLVLLCVVALFFLLSQKSINYRQNLWLFFALAVYGLDILYGIAGGSRYSLGWYVAMINSVFASGIILSVFIYHLTQITKLINNEKNHLKSVSEHDELTKVANRRKFNLIFETLWTLGLHQEKHLCLIFVDIDNFKSYNDTFGHPMGDECLIRIAKILDKISNRETDLVARVGGEEFAIILYGIDLKDGGKFAEKARNMVEEAQISSGSPQRPFVTISAGCGSIVPQSKFNYKNFISKVDKALYRSKNNGKNIVSLAQ